MHALKPPQILSNEVVHDDFLRIEKELLLYPNGHKGAYFSLRQPCDATVVLAKDERGYYLVLEEYRHPMKKVLIGLPGGLMDGNEDPLSCAHRELKEETGFVGADYQLLGSSYPYPGVSSQKSYFVSAKILAKGSSPQLDPSECLRPIFLSPQELFHRLQLEPTDGLLLTALSWEQIKAKNLK